MVLRRYPNLGRDSSGETPDRFQGLFDCVFFQQQSSKTVLKTLWELTFTIARWGVCANVGLATEGGIPLLRFPGRRIAPIVSPGLHVV